jgi:hypothetical protein
MSKISTWLNRQIGSLMLATAKVEQNALSQEGQSLGTEASKFQRHSQGTLADDLVNGVITQEVKDLRWRMYKVLEASAKVSAKVVGDLDSGEYIVETYISEGTDVILNKVKLDSTDDYKLEMVVDAEAITKGREEALNADAIDTTLATESIIDEDGNERKTLGIISNEDNEHHNIEYPIKIDREDIPKFYIEKFTKKLNVRIIDETHRLLEFYISKYPSEYDRKTYLLVSELKRAMVNPRSTNILHIDNIGFVSYKTIGVNDFRVFEYKVIEFDKVVEFDGYFVIKFKCEVTTNGEYLLEKYREVDLDNKYEKKERKN